MKLKKKRLTLILANDTSEKSSYRTKIYAIDGVLVLNNLYKTKENGKDKDHLKLGLV